MPIIAFSGKIGSGKTTIARDLRNYFGSDRAMVVSFSTALKADINKITGVPYLDLCSRKGKAARCPTAVDDWSNGRVLQEYGKFMRRLNPNIWIISLTKRIAKNPRLIWIIDDVRFKNEVAAIKQANGIVIRIDRKTVLAPDGRDLKDISETCLDNNEFAHRVDNNGTFEATMDVIKKIAKKYLAMI